MTDLGKAALILVGYQNEYFQVGGRLYCESIFPTYATVLGYQDLIPQL
jgi:hypothetical protein